MSDATRAEEALVSQMLKDLKAARMKAEEAAAVIRSRYRGAYYKWVDGMTLRVFSRDNQPVATIRLERLQ